VCVCVWGGVDHVTSERLTCSVVPLQEQRRDTQCLHVAHESHEQHTRTLATRAVHMRTSHESEAAASKSRELA
jgi:hypothetical protein